jgi:hypothetical protein
MKRIIYLIILFINTIQFLSAQITYRGIVTAEDTQEPIEMATVKLVKGGTEKLIAYGTTNSKGVFSLSIDEAADSLFIIVSTLGYRQYKQPAVHGKEMKVEMITESINLREVVVRPGRVWGRRDTINYSISDFLASKDESMKDVLKKLPGIDVDNTGKISYNGKDISNFYVEGMDLTDGRYNRINNNLKAQAVEAVQVLENHQAVRMLKNKINSENVAINLKLKPGFRDKWMVNVQSGAGYSPNNSNSDILWNNDLSALQLSAGSQSIYTYKGNNSGQDTTDENKDLFNNGSNRTRGLDVSNFISQPPFVAPLKKERLLFNDVHTASANRLYKLNETTQFRINAGYTHDIRKQERGSETSYYQPGDTTVVAENSRSKIRSDKAELSFNLENNADSRFLTNKFNAVGLWEKGKSFFNGNQSLFQQVNTTHIGLENDLQNLWNKNDLTLEARSFIKYNHQPSRLEIDDRTLENINLNYFYTDNSFSVLRKKGYFMQRYVAGFTIQNSNIQNGYSGYITPTWQLNKGKWVNTLIVPVKLTHFPDSVFTRTSVNPSLSIRYKYNYAWQFSLYANYNEGYGSIADFYESPYYTDYRHRLQNNGIAAIRRDQTYSVYGEYKNTIKEFFATLSVSHNRGWSNRIYEQLIQDKQIIMNAHKLSTESMGWTINGRFSKGFFEYGLKLSLNYTFGKSKAEQMSMGKKVPYESDFMFYEPKITWNPFARFEAIYEGSFRYSRSKIGSETKLSPLLNVIQKINLSYNFTLFELGLTADHYYNDVSEDKGVHTFLLDASLRWSSGSWRVNLYANNLLNKKQYGYTQYSSLQSYTSWINIRGREFLTTVGYRF